MSVKVTNLNIMCTNTSIYLVVKMKFLSQTVLEWGATVNGGNGNGKRSSKLPATIVVQLKMEEICGWYGP